MRIIISVISLLSMAGLTLLLPSCASTTIDSAGQRVMVTNSPAPSNCRYIGMATGNQGNFFTGQFTSNANMQAGAFNALRNQAAQMGGNRVVLLMNQASMTQGRDSGMQTNVATTGNVYYCPDQKNR